MQNSDWLQIEVITGLQKLLCLSLEGQPAAETIPGTAAAWLEVLTNGRVYDEARDAPRIREAFVLLASRCRRWPVPADFLEAMPKITLPSGLKLAHVASEETRVRNMTKISELLGENPDAA